MQTNNLPTDELKKYGILKPDNSFSKKLSADDIQKFLQGYTVVADNKTNRATFQLVENNSRLNVVFLERDKKDSIETNRYKVELQKLKSFLQDKIDQFPEIAKEIANDLNIVSKEINTINSNSQNESNSWKQGQSEVQLNVNDPDLFQDANRKRDEELDLEENREKSRGFKR